MSNVIAFILVFLTTYSLSSLFYRHVVQPTLQRKSQYELFALRDRLRRMAIDGSIKADSFSYRHLESMLNCMANAASWYSVTTWVDSYRWKERNPDSQSTIKEEMSRFEQEATGDLKDIERRGLRLSMRLFMANSPGWVTILGVFLAMQSIKRKVDGWNKALCYRLDRGGFRPARMW